MSKGTLKQVIESWYYYTGEYTSTPNNSLYVEDDVLYSYGEHFPLALHLNGYELINGDKYSSTTGKHQSYTIRQCSNPVEVPFSALAKAVSNRKNIVGYALDMEDLKQNLQVLDTEADTYLHTGRINIKTGEEYLEHVLGASTLRYKDRFFLSSIDETGIGSHAYFLTELPVSQEFKDNNVSLTVEEAFIMLKPLDLRDYEGDIRRQGEWFFVRANEDAENLANQVYKVKGSKKFYLPSDEKEVPSHHYVSEGVKTVENGHKYVFVRGIVKHEKGEHKQLKLYDNVKDKHWYFACKNTQVASFSADGNVD